MDIRYIAFAIGAFCIFHSLRNNYFRDIRPYLSSLDSKHYLRILAAGLFFFTVGLASDVYLHPFLMETRNQWQPVAKVGEFLSQNTEFWMLAFLIYFIAVIARQNKLWHLMEGVLLTTGLSGLTVHLLKFVFMRARPYYEAGPFSFFNIDGLIKHSHRFQSLPSGDVSILAGCACFLFVSTKNPFLRALIAAVPFFVAAGRVHANKHWISDTIASLFIAIAFAVLVRNYHRIRFESPAAQGSRN